MRRSNSVVGRTVLMVTFGLAAASQLEAQIFRTLYSFTALQYTNSIGIFTNSDGAGPFSGLVLSGTMLYGTAHAGGSSGNGTVFALNTNGTGFTILHNFSATIGQLMIDGFPYGTNSDGAFPYAPLTLSVSTLYGTAVVGGSSGIGTVFSLNTDGTGFRTLHDFAALVSNGTFYTNYDGATPYAALTFSGNSLYGTALRGGAPPFIVPNSSFGFLSMGYGTAFSLNTDGTGFKTLHTFTPVLSFGTVGTNADGASPGGLVSAGNMLFGTTGAGGSGGGGTLFGFQPDGTGFTTLHGFSGSGSQSSLILSSNILYGITAGGGSLGGDTLFAVNADFTGFKTLHDFGADTPILAIVSGHTIYATTAYGGPNGNGTVVKINTDGTGFELLYSFSALQNGTNSDGAQPAAGLQLSGNLLYGTTSSGGPSGQGTVFATFAVLPPAIIAQPQSVTLYAGRSAQFSVSVAGDAPFAYQWLLNGTNPIARATNATYALPNVQFGDQGEYSCTITNIVGSVTSSNALLTVVSLPTNSYPLAVLADNPVAYWRLGENPKNGTEAYDLVGGHNGQYTNVTLGVPGFDPTDSDSAVRVGPGINSLVANIQGIDFSTGVNQAFSVECWVNAAGIPFNRSGAGIITKGTGNGGEQFALDLGPNSALGYQWFARDASGDVEGVVQASIGPNNTWQHVVAVYDGPGLQERLYVSGALAGSAPISTNSILSTSSPVAIGSRQSSAGSYDLNFNGAIDEVAIYNKALSSNRVVAHLLSLPPVPPVITLQPVSVTNYVGLTGLFIAAATNMASIDYGPIRYQWKFNGADIPGATSNELVFSSLSMSNSGDYSVAASNNFIGTLSLPAHLTVLPVLDLSTGLVLHLPFDGDCLDYSGRGNNATNVNATSFVAGKIGSGALYFWTQIDPGSSNFNYATLGLRPDLQFSSNVNFSVAYWILYPTGEVQSCDLPVLGNAANSTYNRGYAFAQGGPGCGSGSWTWTINDGFQNVAGIGAPHSAVDGNWHHLAFTFDRTGNGTSYLDGAQVAVQPISNLGNLDTTNATVIGQDPTGVYGYDGAAFLDDLGVWRRVLSPEEVNAMYLFGAGKGQSFAPTAATISIQRVGSQMRLVWSLGTLQSSDAVAGPFNDVTNATSPYLVAPSDTRQFYRLKIR